MPQIISMVKDDLSQLLEIPHLQRFCKKILRQKCGTDWEELHCYVRG